MLLISYEGGYIVAKKSDVQSWNFDITEEALKYHQEQMVEERMAKVRKTMEGDDYEIVAVHEFRWNSSMPLEDDIVLRRVVHFAKKGSWKFITKKEANEGIF